MSVLKRTRRYGSYAETNSPAIEVNRPYLDGIWRDAFSWPQRINNETENRDANAGIGHVKGRPWVSKRHMQIEEQKIDNMSVAKAIGQIPQYARK